MYNHIICIRQLLLGGGSIQGLGFRVAGLGLLAPVLGLEV